LSVDGAEFGVVVIDPSLSPTGPIGVRDWAAKMRAKSVEVLTAGRSQVEILDLHAAVALGGGSLDAVVFTLRLGEPPITDKGGSGFRIGTDPLEGAGVVARRSMADFLKQQGSLPGSV
jgi:hypothetical protein